MKAYLIKANTDTKKLSSVLFPRVFYLETGEKIQYEDLRRNQNGKPQAENGIYFNISHTGNYWCIVFSDSECGIDIELNRTLRARMSRKILFDGEKLIDDNLLKNWVMKEAYAKMIGVGISISFSTIDLESVAEEYEVSDLSAEDYICYAVGATPVTDIVKMNWDGTNLV